MSKRVLEILKGRFGDAIVETHSQLGDDTAVVEPSMWREIATFLRDDPRCAFDMFIDITAVDYLGREPRFEVVCHLRSLARAHRIRIKARVGDAEGDGAERGWVHWTRRRGPLAPGNAKIDLWPEMKELGADERFATGFQRADGRTAEVFSSVGGTVGSWAASNTLLPVSREGFAGPLRM